MSSQISSQIEQSDEQSDEQGSRLSMEKVKVTLLSVWSWAVFGLVVILWLPLMAITRLVTAPFDTGRYWTGFLFRKMAVTHQRLTPMWHFG